MKKIFPVFLTLIFFSCSSEKENLQPQLPDNTPESKAEIVDIAPLNDGDYNVTLQGFNQYYSTTRNLDTRSADNEIVEIRPFIHDGETLFHIIQKEQGWELTSADMRVPRTPIMSETGVFDLQELNEPTKIMISDLAERIYN